MQVLFDPKRHDVLFHRGAMPPKVATALAAMGWQRRGVDGTNEWWTRDRIAVAQGRLGCHTGSSRQLAIA